MFWWWDNFQVEVKFSHTSLVLSTHNVCVCFKYLVSGNSNLCLLNFVTILKVMYFNSNGIKNCFSGFGVGKGQTPLSAMRQVFVHSFLNSTHMIVVQYFIFVACTGGVNDQTKLNARGIDASFPLSQCSFLCLLPLQHFILCLLIRPETKLLIISTLWKDVTATQVSGNKSVLMYMFNLCCLEEGLIRDLHHFMMIFLCSTIAICVL